MRDKNQIIEQLLEDAFALLQHDTGETNPEYVWQRNELKRKFTATLRKRSSTGASEVRPSLRAKLRCNQCGGKPENEEECKDGWDCECGGTFRSEVPSSLSAERCCLCGEPILYAVERAQLVEGFVMHSKCWREQLEEPKAKLYAALAQIERLRAVLDGGFQSEQWEWVQQTFPGETSDGVLKHLKEEFQELESAPTDPKEMADVFLLLQCLASHAGVDLMAAARAKFEECKQRKWKHIPGVGFRTDKGASEVPSSLSAEIALWKGRAMYEGDNCERCQKELADALAQIERLRADERRLDWLEARLKEHTRLDIKLWGHDGRRFTTGDTLLVHWLGCRGGKDETLREAIDAALAQEPVAP